MKAYPSIFGTRPAVHPRPHFPKPRGLKVGLYGGSFNPAHDGHVQVSKAALQALGLDQIWWLVTPGNPLKGHPEHSLEARLNAAKALNRADRRILVTDIENHIKTRYTADTLSALLRRYPNVSFVWIMGADNLTQLTRWARWRQIVTQVPIAVFNRPTYSYAALNGRAAHNMARWRHPTQRLNTLVQQRPPAWGFLWHIRSELSSTALRARRVKLDTSFTHQMPRK